MAGSPAFEAASSCLEQSSALHRLAARGTIRIALKQAGLDARTVTARELGVVAARLLPAELAARGAEPEALCRRIGRALEAVGDADAAQTPEAICARLAGSWVLTPGR
jgi:hypothetical protein